MISNRCIRLTGNLIKLLGYVFHSVLPSYRFTIPAYSPARIKTPSNTGIPRCIWQTNFSGRCTFPVYVNYLFNRLMSLSYDYRYVSTEERKQYIEDTASQAVCRAYSRLEDGAAQADLWRVLTLLNQGGVYMDIDAVLVWPLRRLTAGKDEQFIKRKKNGEITNYFIATAAGNPALGKILDVIVENINCHDGSSSVYNTTGPAVFNRVLKSQSESVFDRNRVCIQGAFTNEHFQYLDRPNSKWTHKNPREIILTEERTP